MGYNTKIDWCDTTWNPVTGCYHGCEYCYARGIANRFGGYSRKQDGTHTNFISDDGTYELNEPLIKIGKDGIHPRRPLCHHPADLRAGCGPHRRGGCVGPGKSDFLGGMTVHSIDHEANLFFNAVFANHIKFHPCYESADNTHVVCDNCRTRLESAYLEERLYAIRCPDCRMVVLLKAPNPYEAAVRVGHEEKLP